MYVNVFKHEYLRYRASKHIVRMSLSLSTLYPERYIRNDIYGMSYTQRYIRNVIYGTLYTEHYIRNVIYGTLYMKLYI